MLKINFKEILLNLIFFLTIFITDRLTKIYILKIAEIENAVDVYIAPYLNLYLIWNKGIAFGLFSFDQSVIYNLLSVIITGVCIVILYLITKNQGIKKYSLISVLGGAIGNVYDRLIYFAVPDFIDFHINNFHWFTFNIADIFITMGITLIIINDLMFKKK